MGFIQNLLQNAQQGTNSPMQSAQSRFGQSGLLESLRNMQGPTQNLPTNRQASQGGSAPFGGGLGGGIQGIIEQLRSQLGQQGLGGSIGTNDRITAQPGSFAATGQWNPRMPTPQVPQGPTTGQWNPRMPTPQIPQMPRFPSPTSTGININQMPGFTPTGPSWAPGSGPGSTPMPPTVKPPSTPMVNPQMPRPTIGMGTPTGGGFATGDPQPTQPQQPTQTQSRYGSLSGIQRPTTLRR